MAIFSKKAEKILKNIKPFQEDLKKRRIKMSNKKQETDRISFIKNEIERHANENDKKCRDFLNIQRKIIENDTNIPEKKLFLSDAIEVFSKICISYPEIEAAFFEARGAEGLAQCFESLLDTVIYDLLQQMFADDISTVFQQIFNSSDEPEPDHEDTPAP